MKKRILVLFAFGISFAPPVFAAEAAHRLGEMKLSQMNLRAARCEERESKKLISAVSQDRHVESNSRGARGTSRAAD